MNGLVADAKHALRVYRHTPVASLLAVVVLAVGMAFVSSLLSLYVDLVLRPHPGVEDGSRIVTVGLNTGAIRVSLLERMAAEVSSLEAIAGVRTTSLEIGPRRQAHDAELVTRAYFGGIRPTLARGLGFEDTDHAADAAPVAVISDDYWREQFDRSPDVLGRVIEIAPRSSEVGDEPIEFRIVGVMKPEMRGLWSSEVAVWLPLERAAGLFSPPERMEATRQSMAVSIVGRRARGVSAAGITSELQARYSDFDEYYLQPGFAFEAIDGIVQNFDVHRDARRQLQLFLGASVLLALVAAANISLFLLARAPGRRRELGIRMSVGAPMKRLARQLASEAALLVVASAVLGLMMSVWLSEFLRGLPLLRRAEWNDVTLLDWHVVSLVVGFLVLVTLAVSLAPILGLKRLGIAASSRQVAASATLAQRLAGTAQIAMAGLFGGAGVAFTWYLGSLLFAHPGYQTDDLYVADFRGTLFGMSGVSIVLPVVEQHRLRETIEALPSVDGVAFGGPVPGGGVGRAAVTLSDPNDPAREIRFLTGTIDGHFIEMLGLELLYGRAPTDSELGVAVINRTAARQYFGRDNVVGESLPIADEGGTRSEIVGVLEDLSFKHPGAEVEPLVFLTVSSGGTGTVIRSSRPVAELQKDMQSLIDSGALEVDSFSLIPLAALRSFLVAPDKARGLFTIATASLVVLLAAFGFYGTQRYLVAAGRREYAIRASLGAGPRSLGRLVLRRGFILSLPGLVVGGLLAFIVVAWLRGDYLPREISAGAVTAAVVLGLTALLLVASLGPAREARRAQPARLLREG